MMDITKFKRFVTFDRAFQVRVALVVGLLFLIRWEGQVAWKQEGLLAKLSVEQVLVAKIPEMQAKLVALQQAAVLQENAEVKPDAGFHLEGIVIENNDFTALINGEIYVIGDVVGKYEIVQITPEGVAVLDRETNQPETIPLPDDGFTVK
jgi:hypothetical protein